MPTVATDPLTLWHAVQHLLAHASEKRRFGELRRRCNLIHQLLVITTMLKKTRSVKEFVDEGIEKHLFILNQNRV
tara:strand:+ start:529 stop:753 length:225 start_codon:yes stop_codon:yes gene_type:complete